MNQFTTCKQEIDDIHNDMLNEMLDTSQFEDVRITVDDVCKALTKLNSNKRDGTRGPYSNHFINCSHKMKVYISRA